MLNYFGRNSTDMAVWGSDMNRMINWLQKEPVLTISWILAFCSMLLVPPAYQYAGYLDLHTLCLLFCLMAVMAGFQRIGFFHRLGQFMLSRTHSIRQLVLLFFKYADHERCRTDHLRPLCN